MPRLGNRRRTGHIIERIVQEVEAGGAGRNYLRQHTLQNRLNESALPPLTETHLSGGSGPAEIVDLTGKFIYGISIWGGADTF